MEEETFTPRSIEDWRNWLEKNHKIKNSIWLIFHKKASGIPSLTWSESVDVALCYGWIDSTKRTIDSEKYMQYFGKRKAKSTWSKINKDKVEKLIKNGFMREPGFKSIEIAKENGSWNLLDSLDNLEIPDDLQKVLDQNPKVGKFYKSLSKSKKKSILGWLLMAKRKETRKKRIDLFLLNAKKDTMPF